MSAPLISPAIAEFIQSGLSITVAARGERLVPSICKAAGCRVEEDGRALTVLLFADAAEAVCRDIASNGQLAVCFSRPSTHETLQIKGSDAQTRRANAQDLACVRRSLDLFAQDLSPLGWDASYVDAVLWRNPADLLAIRFTPAAAYAQTPGPQAGSPLKP
jgi:hypothetical protein